MEWQIVDDSDVAGHLKLIEGRSIVKVEIETRYFDLMFDDGSSLRVEAVALHGMDACIGLNVPTFPPLADSLAQFHEAIQRATE